MSKSAMRFDLGPLRPARRMDDGRIRADVYMTKPGVFEYADPKYPGGVRRELREPKEVFDAASMDSFAQIPVTNGHPPEMVTAKNASKYMVGATGESIERHDEHVRGTAMIADDKTGQDMVAGKRAVSCGYRCDVDYTSGTHPVYGHYDAKQTNIRGNHLAIVSKARAGDSARIRMDHADVAIHRMDDDEDDPDDDGDDDVSGADDDGDANDIEALRDQMTAFSDSDDKKSDFKKIVAQGKKLGVDTSRFESKWENRLDHRSPKMPKKPDKNESSLLEAAADQLAKAVARADEAETDLSSAVKRADEAEGVVASLREKIKELEGTRTDVGRIDELEDELDKMRRTLHKETKARLDAEDPKRLQAAIDRRVKIEAAACETLGVTRDTFDGISDRDVMVTVIKKMHGVAMSGDMSDDYVRARFDSAIEGHVRGNAALESLRDVVVPTREQRADHKSARDQMVERNRNAWKTPVAAQEK